MFASAISQFLLQLNQNAESRVDGLMITKSGKPAFLISFFFVSLFQVGPNGGEQAGKISGDKQESDQGSPNFFDIPFNAQRRTVLSILMMLLF